MQPNLTLSQMLLLPDLPNFLTTINAKRMAMDPKTNPEMRNQLLKLLCLHDFELFVRVFFAPYCQAPFSKMHYDFFAAEANPFKRGRREAIAAPRGHAKTTFKALFKVIHAIVYGLEQFILIIGHSAPEAEAKVRDVLEELENNALLHEVYGPLAPVKGQPGWSTKNFVTQNNIRVMAKSRGKQVRGLKHGCHRPTLILLDDSEAPDKVLNETQRYKTRQWLEKDILKLGKVDGQANVIIVGTCLHPEALLPTLLNAPGWKGSKYQAVHQFAENQALWSEWVKIYTDLTNPNREADADAFFESNQEAMLAGTEVLWPEAEPYVLLMKMRINEGQASFQSEKQNDPYDPDRQIFNMTDAKRFTLEYQPDGEWIGLRWLDGSNRFVSVAHIDRIVAFHDPAMCENKEDDYAAIVVCASDLNGYIYCLDAYIEKAPTSRQIQHAFALHQKWNFYKLFLEDNNFQGNLKKDYRDLQEENTNLRVGGYTQHTNKEKRIASLEPLITSGWLLFNQDLNPRLISQMQLFPTSYDDGPDALHGAVEQLRKRIWGKRD